MGPAPLRRPATVRRTNESVGWDSRNRCDVPEAVKMILPPLSVFPVDLSTAFMASLACLMARKQLLSTVASASGARFPFPGPTHLRLLTRNVSMNSSGSVELSKFTPTIPALAKKASRRPVSATARSQTALMAFSSAASASMQVIW